MTTTKTFDLTQKEMAAALIFVSSCLHGMGGQRPGSEPHRRFALDPAS